MKYSLIENYFQTPLFQRAVQDYFDTVLGAIIKDNATLQAKGLFKVRGEVKKDYYDMPYHIHILNGLIPVLLVYEKYLTQKGWVESPEADIYLRIFMLGFTFHDANKLLGTEQTFDRSDLEIAVANLDEHVGRWDVELFWPEFERHKSTVYYLSLATENGTWVAAEDHSITVNNQDEIKRTQRELCHLADGLASIQNENLESIEALYKAVSHGLSRINSIQNIPISYLKVRLNPYTLLSQNLLQVARKELALRGKKVLYALREGFIFWGEDLSEEEYIAIQKAYLQGSADDIKFSGLTKIDAQKCNFGFIGSTPFTRGVLSKITAELQNKFLALSPNSNAKITGYESFVVFTKKLIEVYDLPVDAENKDGKLALRYFDKIDEDEDYADYRTVYNLHKIQWLNTKQNPDWKADFDIWASRVAELPEPIEMEIDGQLILLNSISDLLAFIQDRVNSSNALFKTYLNFIKTYLIIQAVPDIGLYIEELQNSIIKSFTPNELKGDIKQPLFNRYFECKGNANLLFLNHYDPSIPTKKEMCAFTGGLGNIEYDAATAFGMKARGFSNRTITTLNNNKSHVSELFAEENKLRASLFNVSDSNFVIYQDFFETQLDIDRDIIKSCISAKSEVMLLKDGAIEFDKSSKFQYNLYNLDFIKLSHKVEPTFFLVRKCLRIAQELGLRSYISGIMTPYASHKAVFHFENAPRFLKLLGWDSIRLGEVAETLDEIRLILIFGKDRIESNLLKIAVNRRTYFRLFYELKEKDKVKVANALKEYFEKYKHKFQGMTITEELVKLAVQVDLAGDSSASETWLIRTATEYLRRYTKQGKSREDVIQKICGEIKRKLRMEYPNPDAIEAFATAVYDRLYLEDWGGKIPTLNVEKDWIYQFAFLFSKESGNEKHLRKARSIKKELESEGKEISLANIKPKLSPKAHKYAEDYLKTIKNL